jgi:hypothetical protein
VQNYFLQELIQTHDEQQHQQQEEEDEEEEGDVDGVILKVVDATKQ